MTANHTIEQTSLDLPRQVSDDLESEKGRAARAKAAQHG
jgi:hypothetical protein